MKFLRVVLHAPASNRRALEHFYSTTLEVGSTPEGEHRIGSTCLAFEPHSGEPFYHYAILVPGDRFAAAHAWAHQRIELLGEPIHFDNWDADSLYFHDPAGNIVELIAHQRKAQNGRHGGFTPAEFLGLSEVGLVGDVAMMATALEPLDMSVFQGAFNDLAFVGEPTGTIILSEPGRGWLPQNRPAEPYPVQVTVDGAPKGTIKTNGHTVRRRGR